MADFKIRLKTEINKGDAEKQLKDLKKQLEKEKIKLSIDVDDIKSQLDKLKDSLKNAFKLDGDTLKGLRDIKTTLQEINRLQGQKNKNSNNNSKNNVESIKNERMAYEKLAQSIRNQMTKVKDNPKAYSALEAQLTRIENLARNAKGEVSKLGREQLDTSHIKNYSSQFDSVKTKIETLSKTLNQMQKYKFGSNAFIDNKKLNEQISKVNKLKKDLNNLNPNSGNYTQEFQKINSQIDKCTQNIKELQAEGKKGFQIAQNQNSIDSLSTKIDALRTKATNLGATTSPLNGFEQKLRDIANLPLGQQTTALGKLRNEVNKYANSLKNLNKVGKNTNSFFGNLYSSMTSFSLGNIIAMQLTKGVYAIKDTIVELDSAFRDLEKVAPASFKGTTEELKELKNQATLTGQEVARSSVDIINSTASALQSGFKDINKAMEYARNVNMFANVAEVINCLCS